MFPIPDVLTSKRNGSVIVATTTSMSPVVVDVPNAAPRPTSDSRKTAPSDIRDLFESGHSKMRNNCFC